MKKVDIKILGILILLVISATLGYILYRNSNFEVKYKELEKENSNLIKEIDQIKSENDEDMIYECSIIKTGTLISITNIESDVEEEVILIFSVYQNDPLMFKITKEEFDSINISLNNTYELSLFGSLNSMKDINYFDFNIISAVITDKTGMDQIQEGC